MDYGRTSSSYTEHQVGLTRSEITSLFRSETGLADEFFENQHKRIFLEGEKRLMFAILEDAVQCFRDNDSAQSASSKRLFDEAQQWIFHSPPDGVFSFENICDVLGFDPAYIRKGLVR